MTPEVQRCLDSNPDREFPFRRRLSVYRVVTPIRGWLQAADLGRLYQKYGYLVHRRCLAILQNRSDADDVLQEVFLRVQRFGNSREPTLQWLYAIAANASFDYLRRRHREERLAEVPAPAVNGAQNDPDRRALLGAILRRFDPKTREIGILHHLDGFTQEEVAGRTGYSRKTVGKKLKAFEEAFQRLWLTAHPEVKND